MSFRKKSDAMNSYISDLKAEYLHFNDPNNSSVIAVNKVLVKKTLEKVRLDEKINKYRVKAKDYEAKISELKLTYKFKKIKLQKYLNK